MADRETFVSNSAESSLSASLSASSTTVNVTDTTPFSAVPFYVTIDPGNDAKREVVRATAKTSTTLTVVRGEDGTTGVEHDTGAVIAQVPVAALWTDINDRADAISAVADAAYQPGGADVAVADGGTGASTAAAARTNLGAAADADVVKLTGDQTVAGVKTFSSSPVVPAPTTDMQAATKKYVDDNGSSSLSQSLPAGRYLTSPGLRSAAAAAIPRENAWAIPFPLAIGGSVDRIACEVTGAQADTVVRMGIYASGPNGLPGALVVDAGTVSADTTGAKEITLSPAVELAPGFYWLVAVTQGAADPSLTRVAGYGARAGSATLSQALQDTRAGVRVSGVGGALPDPFGAVSDVTTPNWPLILVRGA